MRQTWNRSLYSLKTGLLGLSRFTFGKPALAIVLVAILQKLLFLPLKIKNARQTRLNRQKLEKLQADVQAINDKYQPESDPELTLDKVTQRGKELKELYQREGVTFKIGCASILLPTLSEIFLLQAVNSIKDDARFSEGGILWFKDLTRPDRYRILPVVFIGIGTLRQRLLPTELPEFEKPLPVWARRIQALEKWLPLIALLATLVARKRPNAATTLYQLTSSGAELVVDYYIKRTIIDQD